MPNLPAKKYKIIINSQYEYFYTFCRYFVFEVQT